MSAKQETLSRNTLEVNAHGIVNRSGEFFLQVFRTSEVDVVPARTTTTTTSTANAREYVMHNYQSIIPLKGVFADDDAWDDMPEFLENYWREMDEIVETV